MTDRERRSVVVRSNADKFAAMRAARLGQARRTEQVQIIDDDDRYIDDEQATLQDNDFVEDDMNGDYLNDNDEYSDYDDDTSDQRRISKVAMPGRKRKGQPSEMPQKRIAGAFIGAGSKSMIGPGSMSNNVNAAPLNDDAISDLLHVIDDEVDDANAGDKINEKHKKRKLAELAMFGQHGQVERSFEDGDAADVAVYNPYTESMVLQQHNTATMQFNAPPPRLTGDDIGDDKENSKVTSLLNMMNKHNDASEFVDVAAGTKFAVKQERTDSNQQNGGDEYDPVDGTTAAMRAAAAPVTANTNKQLKQTSVPASKFTNNKPSAPRLPQQAVRINPKAFDWYKLVESGALDKDTLTNDNQSAHIAAYPSNADVADKSPIDSANNLQLYYLDAYEDSYTQRGTVYLFGKALMADGKSTASCAVQVKNMQRNIFFLPRKYKLEDSSDDSSVTDDLVDNMSLYNEVKEVLNKYGITKFACKPVERSYAWDRDMDDRVSKASLLDNEKVIPDTAKYLKVVYSFSDQQLPRNLTGKTFSRVFNTQATCLENFLLKRDVMGPQWLTVSAPVVPERPFSWCKFEYVINDSKAINVTTEPIESPVLSVMSLNIKTVLNNKNKHEIACISALTHSSVNVDGPTPNEFAVNYTTYISKLSNWTEDTHSMSKAINQRKWQSVTPVHQQRLVLCSNETEMLNKFFMSLQQVDCDVIVGHDLHSHIVEILIARCKALKVQQWSKIGRLRRSKIPQQSGDANVGGQMDISLVDKGIGCGRLLADTLVTAKELLLGQRQYTLSYLANSQLDGILLNEIDTLAVKNYYSTDISSTGNDMKLRQCDRLLQLIRSNENESFLAFRLMYQLELLPLTKQLTNLCGNLWYRTMRASRAERVEYLLLHEFYRMKYIVPEKLTARERKAKQQRNMPANEHDENKDEDNKPVNKKSKSKPQYAGGLVLEPKKGFYDKYILLLDFNSLYPSIIQEYNICFTTVDHWTKRMTSGGSADVSEYAALPPLPKPDVATGKLPAVLKRLIQRRAAVKQLIKNERNTAALKQLDIRQKALKLVANSMYGCLGFVASRFYCEPLASLVTAKGRETLQSTVDLVTNLGLNVIYGDTDSIMIDTNELQLDRVHQIGKQIQTEVNKRHKILELGLDGIFKHMLLLRKKKYAALVVEADGSLKRETKGLDLVRRDWCDLSKSLGNQVLDIILDTSGKKTRDDVVNSVHSALEQCADDLNNNRVSLNQFIITKSLTKNPTEYTDAKSQPHVQVALQLIAGGQKAVTGDIIPYVICVDSTGEKKSLAERAYHPKQVEQAAGKLQVDTIWYKTHQLLPPIVRLCSVMEETDAARIAHCLGLDSRHYAQQLSKQSINDSEGEIIIVNSMDDDIEKFKYCKTMSTVCTQCNVAYQFPGVYHLNVLNDKSLSNNIQSVQCGLRCSACSVLPMPETDENDAIMSRLSNQLTHEVRRCIQQFYTSDYQCNDQSCGRRTKLLSLKSNKCSNKCNGQLMKLYTHEDLYMQLSYLSSLFDIDRANHILAAENKRRMAENSSNAIKIEVSEIVGNTTDAQRQVLTAMHKRVTQVLDMNAYHWIPLSTVFSFVQLKIQ